MNAVSKIFQNRKYGGKQDFQMIYTVIKIEEDIDFGCEERTSGSEVMAVVTLRDSEGNETMIRYPDRELYEKNINEGDVIRREPDGSLRKSSERKAYLEL